MKFITFIYIFKYNNKQFSNQMKIINRSISVKNNINRDNCDSENNCVINLI